MNLGGARPTLFTIQLSLPPSIVGLVGGGALRKLSISARASELPSSQLGNMPMAYMGRTINNPGDRTFSPWTIRAYCDEDFSVRDMFENWSNTINSRLGNIRNTADSNPLKVKANGTISQFSRVDDQTPIRTYTFQGCWPQMVDAIGTDWGAIDQVEEFGTTLLFDWWDVSGPTVLNNQS
jgi:hypothetical protein